MIGALVVHLLWKGRVEKAFNTRDVDLVLEAWAEDAVFEFGGTSAMAGRYEGKEDLRRFFTTAFDRYQAVECTVGRVAVTRPHALGATNTVMSEMHFDITTADDHQVEVDVVNVSELRRGNVVRGRDYPLDETPLLLVWGRKSQRLSA